MVAIIAVAYALVAASTVYLVRTTMRAQALESAAEHAENIMQRHLAIHRYFTDELLPSLDAVAGGSAQDIEFDPRCMSSRYAISVIQSYYVETEDGTPYYYREAAVGARNPVSEADAVEAAYIAQVDAGNGKQEIREVREIDGEPYYVVMRPGEVYEESCLGCHSQPELAPAGLVDIYGDTAGFGKQVGMLASIVSVRIPLGPPYRATDITTYAITAELLLIMLLSSLGVYLFNRSQVLRPVRSIRDAAVDIAGGAMPPGTTIDAGGPLEVHELATAFSTMSRSLAQTIDSLEERVAARTERLDAMNQELYAEISERESIEEQLAAEKAYAENLIETANVIVLGLDTDRRVTVFNRCAQRVTGYRPEDVMGKPWFDIAYTGSERAAVLKVWENLFDPEAPGFVPIEGQEGVSTIRTADGRERVIQWRRSTLVMNDVVMGTISFGIDITRSRQQSEELERYKSGLEALVEERTRQLEATNEQLRRATEAKSQFLTNMSHELRTPLNSVIGFTDVLLRELAGPLTEEQQRQLVMVSDAGKYLLSLVNAVLDLSKVENGAISVDIDVFDLRDVMETVAASLEPSVAERHLEFIFDCPEQPVMMRSDETKVRQILLNIASNAVKFTGSGAVTMGCDVHEDSVTLRVSDTGHGIPPDELSSVFAVFWQHKVGERAKPEGAGLGLAIARRLAHLLGGGINVSSQMGVGSVFTVELPLEVPAYEVPSDDDDVLI
jgi:PAS domain S-box-containing protein